MNACLNGPSDANNNTESSNKIPHKSRYTIGGGKRKASATPSSDLLPNNEADPQFYPSFAKKVPKFIGQKFSQASFYITCLTCLFCLSVGFIGHYSGFYNNSATISSSSSTSAHKLNKRDTSYFTNQIPIQNSFNSRQLFSTPNQKISKKDKISGMSQDLLLLLESTIVMEELASNIQNGNICRGIYNNEFDFDFVAGSGSGFRKQNQNKLRVFQQNHDNSESELREKFRQKFKNLKVTHSKNEDPDAGCQHNNSTVSLQKSKTIRNNFLHFAEIYNSTQAKDPFAYEEYKMKNGSKNRKRSTKKSVENQRKSQQTLLPGQQFFHDKIQLQKNSQLLQKQKVERKKLNHIMSKLLAQYSTANSAQNDTIFFFSNLNRKAEDEKSGNQFLNIPLGFESNDLSLYKKPKMSFFVSTPFEGQAVILNNSYVVQDTIIMRIDCDVTATEYIGYGSDPGDLLSGGSNIRDMENGNVQIEFGGGNLTQSDEDGRL